jgi:hypothetical protein
MMEILSNSDQEEGYGDVETGRDRRRCGQGMELFA